MSRLQRTPKIMQMVSMVAGRGGNMHVCQKDRIPRQRVPAPPPHALSNSRETYLANILTASVFCANDLQRFRKFTVESQKQWMALLESYQDIKYREFTPGYEEVPEILEKLRAVLSDRYASSQPSKKRAKQPQKNVHSKFALPVTSTHSRPYASVNSKTMLPPDDMMPQTQTKPAFQHPESMRYLPRSTPQSFRKQIRDQGFEGVFVEFSTLASLATDNPIKRYKEHLERHRMADFVE